MKNLGPHTIPHSKRTHRHGLPPLTSTLMAGRVGAWGLALVPALVMTLVLTLSTTALAVGTRTFKLQTLSDFEGGELDGVALDTRGRVRPGFDLGKIPVTDGTGIWDILVQSDGTVLLATGNEGKLLAVKDGRVKELADSEALAITSLTSAWGGTVVMGTIPEGRVLQWKGGKLTELAKLPDVEHVWKVAYDAKRGVVYAATGPDGKVFRITRDGRATVYFDAQQSHIMSLAVGPTGAVYAGSSEDAIIYEIKSAGRATVLHDFEVTEVRGIAVSRDGSVFAIANTLKLRDKGKGVSGTSPPGPSPTPSDTKGSGVLYRFSPEGTPQELVNDKDDYFVSLALDDNGQPYFGTGVEGQVYTVSVSTLDVALMADVDERMVSALWMRGKKHFIAASDPGVLHPVRGLGGPNAIWTSKPLDAGLKARFGRLSWRSDRQLSFSTRTGNTKEPDDTWSAWSPALTEEGDIASPRGRFIQVRARWNRAPNAILEEVTIPFITENLRPVLTTVGVSSSSDLETGIKSSGGPITDSPTKEVSLSWAVDNPDLDRLEYFIDYRIVGTSLWATLLPPGKKVTGTSYDWDTTAFPEGAYHLRVKVTDAPSNPPANVKTDQMMSEVIYVDNSPPLIPELRVVGRHVLGLVRDKIGPIQRIEISVAGTDEWYPFFPVDGIFDRKEERFDADVSHIVPSGPALLSVRVYDRANNSTVRSIQLP